MMFVRQVEVVNSVDGWKAGKVGRGEDQIRRAPRKTGFYRGNWGRTSVARLQPSQCVGLRSLEQLYIKVFMLRFWFGNCDAEVCLAVAVRAMERAPGNLRNGYGMVSRSHLRKNA
jgi:hypothetical protein